MAVGFGKDKRFGHFLAFWVEHCLQRFFVFFDDEAYLSGVYDVAVEVFAQVCNVFVQLFEAFLACLAVAAFNPLVHKYF